MTTKISITLPLYDNDGVSLADEVESIKDELLTLAGGFTETLVHGCWRDETGKIHRDTSHLVYTIVEDMTAHSIETVCAPRWAARLRQICVLVEITPVSVAFVEPVKVRAA